MLKSTFAFAALALAATIAPADAQRKYVCTEADIRRCRLAAFVMQEPD